MDVILCWSHRVSRRGQAVPGETESFWKSWAGMFETEGLSAGEPNLSGQSHNPAGTSKDVWRKTPAYSTCFLSTCSPF